MMSIGDRIRQIRGKTPRAEFAEMLGIHPQTLYMYEKGKRVVDVDLLQQLCLKSGVSIEWLVFGNGGADGEREAQDHEIEERLQEKERLLARQEEYIKQLKDELISAQAEAIRAYELALGTLQDGSGKERDKGAAQEPGSPN